MSINLKFSRVGRNEIFLFSVKLAITTAGSAQKTVGRVSGNTAIFSLTQMLIICYILMFSAWLNIKSFGIENIMSTIIVSRESIPTVNIIYKCFCGMLTIP